MPVTYSTPRISSTRKPAIDALDRSSAVPKDIKAVIRPYQPRSARESRPSPSAFANHSAAELSEQAPERIFTFSPELYKVPTSACSSPVASPSALVHPEDDIAGLKLAQLDEDESWELRTETVGAGDQGSDLDVGYRSSPPEGVLTHLLGSYWCATR